MPEANPTKSLSAIRVILLWCALIAITLSVLLARFDLMTDLGVFMPPTPTAQEKLLISQLGKGPTSRLLFVGLQGVDVDQLAALNQRLAARLRKSNQFRNIYNGDQEIGEAEKQLLFDYRYHLSKPGLAQRFSEQGLRLALNDRLKGLMSPLAAVEKKYLALDPVGSFLELIEGLARQRASLGPRTQHGVWFSKDLSRSLLIAEISADGLNLSGQQKAVSELQQVFEFYAAENTELLLSGPAAFAVQARDTIKSDVRLLSVSALTCISIFLFIAFKSIRFLLLLFVPLSIGILAAVTTVVSVFGSIHGITLAFGVTLIGVAVDYPIHLMSQLRGGTQEAVSKIKRIWPTLRLGMLTTVIAYACLIVSDFQGLKQLGVFTVMGLISAAAATRWLLPYLMPCNLDTEHGLHRSHGAFEALGRRAPRARLWALVVIIIAAAYLLLTDKPIREYNLDSLSPVSQQSRTIDALLRADLGTWYGARLMAVIAPGAELVLQKSEALRERLEKLVLNGDITGYDMAADYLPSEASQLRRLQELPSTVSIKARLEKVLPDLPFKPSLFGAFPEAVKTAKNRTPLTLDALSATAYDAILAPLIFKIDNYWVAPILLHGVTAPDRIQSLSYQADKVEVFYLDLKVASNQVMVNAMDRMLRQLAWGGLFIYLILALHFRDTKKPLAILVPVLGAVAVTAAILVFLNIQLSLFHIVSLLLVVGLGLDYALFFNRLSVSDDEWATTFKALWLCCITTVLVFGALILSDIPSLKAVGLTVSIGALLCLIFGATWSSSTEQPPSPLAQWKTRRAR